MKVNDNIVDKIAELSKLEFNREEKEEIKSDMQKILSFIDKLGEVDTENVEPLYYVNPEPASLRPDFSRKEVTQKQALQNAPQKDSDYIKVPKVLDKDKEA